MRCRSAGGAAVSRHVSASVPSNIAFWLLCSALAVATLSFGAVEAWSLFVLQACTAIVVVLCSVHIFRSQDSVIRLSPALVPMAGIALIGILQLTLGLTAYSYETKLGVMRFLCYGAIALAGLQLLHDTDRLRSFSHFTSIFGGLLAVFALLQDFSSNGKLYWVRTPRFGGYIFGPYVNHNHYAGMMELLFPFPLLMALRERKHVGLRILYGFAAFIMLVSIVLSGSRGGMLAALLQLGLIAALNSRGEKRWMSSKPLIGFVIACALFAFWWADAKVMSRIESLQSHSDKGIDVVRVQIVRDSVAMVKERPLLGFGVGNFANVYPKYRSFFDNRVVNQAHNDYLQMLVETGILGFALTLAFIFLVVRGSLNMIQKGLATQQSFAMAALASCTGIFAHSFTDFNLQVPANAAWFFLIATIASKTAFVQAGVPEMQMSRTRELSADTTVEEGEVPIL